MIYIETNNTNKVIYIHNFPFDENDGLGKTEAELLETGYLVDNMPTDSSPKEGKESVLMYDGTDFYFTYEEGHVTIDQKVKILENENADLWYDTMLKDARILEHDNDIADIWYEIMTGGAA